MLHRYDFVDAIVDGVAAAETDDCLVALVCCKRCCVRFKQGRLAELRAAYLHTLARDPK